MAEQLAAHGAELDLDAGNTRLKWRLRQPGHDSVGGALAHEQYRSAEALLAQLEVELPGQVPIAVVRVASVASGDFNVTLREWAQRVLTVEPLFARVTEEASGVEVGYDDWRALGVDRWLAVLAVAAEQSDCQCRIVVSCGSAITVDVLKGKHHQGGYIAPGLSLMMRSLNRDTAHVRAARQSAVSLAVGRSTAAAVNAGLVRMIKGLVSTVIADFVKEGEPVELWVTGGDRCVLIEALAEDLSLLRLPYRDAPELVLDGLQWARCFPLASE